MWMVIRNNLKIIKTLNLYLALFCMGLSVSVTGPCLLDLQQAISTDTQHIALIYTCRSIGYLVGAILGGILLDIVPSKFSVLTACNFLITVTMFGIPWCRNENTLLTLVVINGISLSALNTGANVICVELWHRGPFLQALHFTFGVGGLVSPLIAAPFLEYHNEVDILYNTTSNHSNYEVDISYNTSSNRSNNEGIHYNLTSDSVHYGIPKVTYPFSIIGMICIPVTALLFVTFVVSPRDVRESLSNKKCNSHRGYVFMFFTVIFTFLIFFVIAGTEYGFAQALTTYAAKGPLHSTTITGSYMTSAFWAAFTMMRFISVFLSIKLSDATLIVMDLILIATAGVLLMFFMPNEWILWAACVTCGAGLSSTYPSFVGWIDNYIVVTSKITSIFAVGCAAGEMVVPFIITYFMDSIPEMFGYVTAASSILTASLFLILTGILKNDKRTSKGYECS